MFKLIKLSNYRTHVETALHLKDITLIIGSNNSGKSNLLNGLHYFSTLVSAAFPESGKSKELRKGNYFRHKHSLSSSDVPLCFYCEWEKGHIKITYELRLYCMEQSSPDQIGCKEKIVIHRDSVPKIFLHGYEEASREMLLRTKLKNENLSPDEISITNTFFRSLSFLYYYHFQPSFLKGSASPLIRGNIIEKKNYSEEFARSGKFPNISAELGREGANFLELVRFIKEKDEIGYGKFLGYLKRFVKSFNGIIIDRNITKWQFDMGGNSFPYFESGDVSDGLVKAGAVALLCAMRNPPAIIMIEEIENGINQKNVSEFLSWLEGVSEGGKNTQFILTTHSPSVIREFSGRLDSVYNLHLRAKDYRTTVTNLNDAIKPLVNMGRIKEEDIAERDGKEIVQVSPYELTELFYDGILGEI
jgi:AAA15 family ATPase/GTPase